MNFDLYTHEILNIRYRNFKNFVKDTNEIKNKYKINIRLPCFPEDISENIIKFIIHKNGDKSSNWNCKSGDLISTKEGIQECKCFSSDAPISFSPTPKWDVIYFLDGREWLENDKFKLFKVDLKPNSNEWKNIKFNKNETFEDQISKNRRPRINWNSLEKNLGKNCIKIFDGTFDEIFKD